MNKETCIYCDKELVYDNNNDVLQCNSEKNHRYEKVNDGELIIFFVQEEYKDKGLVYMEKYAFYHGRQPNFTSNFAVHENFSDFKNKTIEEIEFLYNKYKIFE